MIVKRFGCTVVHMKALYKCLILFYSILYCVVLIKIKLIQKYIPTLLVFTQNRLMLNSILVRGAVLSNSSQHSHDPGPVTYGIVIQIR